MGAQPSPDTQTPRTERTPARITPAFDITDTDAGRFAKALIVEHRQANLEEPSPTDQLRIYAFEGISPDDEVVAAPESMGQPVLAHYQEDDGSEIAAVQFLLLTGQPAPSDSEPVNGRAPMFFAPYWATWGNNCFTRLSAAQDPSKLFADYCYYWYRMADDGVGTADYWSLKAWGTIYSQNASTWRLAGGFVDVQEYSGATDQTWVDWDPGASGTDNCDSVTLGVNIAFLSISYDLTWCETWTLTKSNPLVQMRVFWTPPGTGLTGTNTRQVGLLAGSQTAEGGNPAWTFTTAIRFCNSGGLCGYTYAFN